MQPIALKSGKATYYFQQDVAPPRKVNEAKPFLRWPADSPDLSVLDYFGRNELKEIISKMENPAKNEAELRTEVCIACAVLNRDKACAANDNLVKRRKRCLQVEEKSQPPHAPPPPLFLRNERYY